MKYLIIMVIIIFSLFSGYADQQVRLVAGACIDSDNFREFTSDSETPCFWGLGWEVINNHLGIGGNYYSNFTRDDYQEWSVDWYSEALFISYHIFGGKSFIDPFVQAGLGCGGDVYLGDTRYDSSTEKLTLAIFPFVSAGVTIVTDNFLVGTKLNYTPVMNPIPVTSIKTYSLHETQLHIFTGIYF